MLAVKTSMETSLHFVLSLEKIAGFEPGSFAHQCSNCAVCTNVHFSLCSTVKCTIYCKYLSSAKYYFCVHLLNYNLNYSN